MILNYKNLFIGHIESDKKKYIIKMKLNDLIDNNIIHIPNEQRLKDQDKINEIIEYQKIYYKKNGIFNMLGVINIHYCEENKQNYLVDGQHRYNAINKLYTNGYTSINILFEYIIVDTMEELKQNYELINKNTPLPEFPKEINKNIPENVALYFISNYPTIFKNNKRPFRPYINKNDFQEALGYLTLKLNTAFEKAISIEELKKIIKDKNEKMKRWPIKTFENQIRKIKKWPEYKEKADNEKFYLGMYLKTGEEWYYDWIKDIIAEQTGVELKKKKKIKKNKKTSIPKIKKQEIWETYIGDKNKAKCWCCNKKEIKSMTSWHAGHIISEKDGGSTNIVNLRPVCADCNLGMKTQNMIVYMKEHYPENPNIKMIKNNNKTKTNKSKTFWIF
jgi:hypothetical protein